MEENLGAVVWGIGLFIVPAVALLVAAILIGTRRRRDGQPPPTVNRWIIAEAVIVAGPVAACCALGVASWRDGSGVLGVLAAGGIALLLLAGLYLGFVSRAGGRLGTSGVGIPSADAGPGNRERVGDRRQHRDADPGIGGTWHLGADSAVLLLHFFSGILLIVSGQPGTPEVDTTTTQPDRNTGSVGPASDVEAKAASPHQTPV